MKAQTKEETKGEENEVVTTEDLDPKKLANIPYEIISTTSKNAPALSQDYLFKLIIIGNSGVGKSCLMHRVTTNEFSEDHEVTVGVEFGSLLIRMGEQNAAIESN